MLLQAAGFVVLLPSDSPLTTPCALDAVPLDVYPHISHFPTHFFTSLYDSHTKRHSLLTKLYGPVCIDGMLWLERLYPLRCMEWIATLAYKFSVEILETFGIMLPRWPVLNMLIFWVCF